MAFRLFHVTTADNAAAILREGFKDGRGIYMTDQVLEAVWLTDQPWSVIGNGVKGDTVLEVVFRCARGAIADWEWIEEGKEYREWLIPAEFIKMNATTRAG